MRRHILLTIGWAAPMTYQFATFVERVVSECFSTPPDETSALCLMHVLHTHRFYFPAGTLEDHPTAEFTYPLTQRHSGKVVGNLRDEVYVDWYWTYNTDPRVPYGLPDAKLREIVERLESHAAVSRLDLDS